MVDELVGNAHGNLARVQELLAQHPELLNAKATWDETPIEAGTQMGNRASIDELVARGAPVDFFTALVLGGVERAEQALKANLGLANSRGVHDLPARAFSAIRGAIAVSPLLSAAG